MDFAELGGRRSVLSRRSETKAETGLDDTNIRDVRMAKAGCQPPMFRFKHSLSRAPQITAITFVARVSLPSRN